MICRSCGNAYDYDYFAGENLLEAADRALAHKSFSAAKDMYTFMLDKEPSNVKALRGLILAKNEVVRLFDITPRIKSGTFAVSTFNLDKYRNNTDPEALAFIGKTDRIQSLYKDYIAKKKALKKLKEEAKNYESDDSEGAGGLFYYESGETLKKKAVAFAVCFVVLLLLTILCGVNGSAPDWLMAVLITAMAAMGILILAAVLRLRNIDKQPEVRELSEVDKIKARVEETKGEMDRIISEINDVLKEMN